MHTAIFVVLGLLTLAEALLLGITLGAWHDGNSAGVWGWAAVGVSALIALGLIVLLGGHRAIGRWWNAPHPHFRALGNTISGWWNNQAAPAIGRGTNGFLGAILDHALIFLGVCCLVAALYVGWKGHHKEAFYLGLLGVAFILFGVRGFDLIIKDWKWVWLGVSVAHLVAAYFLGYSWQKWLFWSLSTLAAIITLCEGWTATGKVLGKVFLTIFGVAGKLLLAQYDFPYNKVVAVALWWVITWILLNIGPFDSCERVMWTQSIASCQELQTYLSWAYFPGLGLLGALLTYSQWKERDDAQQRQQNQAQQQAAAQPAQAQQQGRNRNRRGRNRGQGGQQPI